MNRITINSPRLNHQRINYSYSIEGEWRKAFRVEEDFYIEYNCNIANVPEGIAVVPLLANILPIAWIYDAQIYVPVCDRAFYESIREFKKGYQAMYPMLEFKGEIIAGKLEDNHSEIKGGSAAFFSGGVDAFNTLVCHAEEHPTLLTLWGADIKLNDKRGWENVEKHLEETAEDFHVDYVTIKSSFRTFLNESVLQSLVIKRSGDGWWHGFQHGIGIISHAAPVAYVMGKTTVYFASSFTAADKGKVTCASDPSIDNYVRFGDTHIVHDGYEFTRQMKIHNITEFSKKYKRTIPLRVCWESTGGSNCCKCEKCWRTILGIYAEGENPIQYGFKYSDAEFKILAKRMKFSTDKMLSELRYGPIQDTMRKNWKKEQIPSELKWFYKTKRNKLGKHTYIAFLRKLEYKIKQIVRSILRRGS